MNKIKIIKSILLSHLTVVAEPLFLNTSVAGKPIGLALCKDRGLHLSFTALKMGWFLNYFELSTSLKADKKYVPGV